MGPLGKEGIIAEHPTLKVKYSDPEMAKSAVELRVALEEERRKEKSEHEKGESMSMREESEAFRIHIEQHHHKEH